MLGFRFFDFGVMSHFGGSVCAMNQWRPQSQELFALASLRQAFATAVFSYATKAQRAGESLLHAFMSLNIPVPNPSSIAYCVRIGTICEYLCREVRKAKPQGTAQNQ